MTSSAAEQDARDIAESARETEWAHPSFVRELFLGRFRLDLIHPHPVDDPAETARAAPFLAKLRAFMERVDSEEIDRSGEIPEPLVQELRDMGAFGIKIPKEYGGLGLSQLTYTRAMQLVTSKDGSLVALHNLCAEPRTVPLTLEGCDSSHRLVDLLQSGEEALSDKGTAEIPLEGYGYRWLRVVAQDSRRLV